MELRTKTTELDAKSLKAKGDDGASLGDGEIAHLTCCVTSRNPDRDNDILEPSGATIDPKQALRFNHDPSQPVGKLLGVVERDDEKIVAKYAVLDTALGRDVLTLVKAGALRISHGFRPLEFEQRKGSQGGWHIRKYELVETSLVAIPANVDAEILSLSTKSFESQPVKAWVDSIKKDNSMTTATQTPPAETKAGTISVDEIKKAVSDGMTEALTALAKGNGNADGAGGTGEKRLSQADLLLKAAGGGTGTTDVRVKSVAEKYSRDVRTMKHAKTGGTVFDANGREPQSISELNHAKAGAFLRAIGAKQGLFMLTDEDRALMELTYQDKWCGSEMKDGQYNPEISGMRMKDLLNDNVSGGANAAPY